MSAIPALRTLHEAVGSARPLPALASRVDASGRQPLRLKADTLRPYVGILGVLIGAILSFIGSRVTSFGLADLRGGLHIGYDEGAWMTTSFGVGQMVIGVACPYLGAVFSVRRVLLLGMASCSSASLLGPLSPNLDAFLTAQFLAGVGSGTFIPAHHQLHRPQSAAAAYRLRARRLRDELRAVAECRRHRSRAGIQTIWSWRWIDWQYCLCAAGHVRMHLVRRAAREDRISPCCGTSTGRGLVYSGVGFCLLYAGARPGQPARLDATTASSTAFSSPAALLTAAFVWRGAHRSERPFLNLRVLAREGLF